MNFLDHSMICDLRPENIQKTNPERHKSQANALIDPCKLSAIREVSFQISHHSHYAPTFKTILVALCSVD